MAVVFTFHTEDPDGVGDDLNIILFPDLSPSAGPEVALLTRKWDAILGGGGLKLLCGHESDNGKEKGRPHCRLG